MGAIGLRWKQVPILMIFGGLIGYSIRPSQRGKGYASEMLKLAVENFANTDIENVLITCKNFKILTFFKTFYAIISNIRLDVK